MHWQEDPLFLRIRPFARLDLSLTTIGADAGTFPKLRQSESFAVHRAPKLHILGRSRPAGEVTVYETSTDGNVAGVLGSLFFQEGCLGYDPAGRMVGYRVGPATPGAASAPLHLPGVGDWSVPLTTSLRFKKAPTLAPVTMLCLGTQRSGVTPRFAEQLPASLIAEDQWIEVEASPDHVLRVPGLRVIDEPNYAVGLGVDGVDVVLGIDVLRSYTTIFDYVSCAFNLFPYRAAI